VTINKKSDRMNVRILIIQYNYCQVDDVSKRLVLDSDVNESSATRFLELVRMPLRASLLLSLVCSVESLSFCSTIDIDAVDKNPQTLLFSATLPDWVHQTARKYLRPDRKHLDLVGDDRVKTSKTVQVFCGCGCCSKSC
jgi:hypothetical protein